MTPLPLTALRRLLSEAEAGALASFFFTPETVLAPPTSEAMSAVVGWPALLLDPPALQDVLLGIPPVPVVAAFAVGLGVVWRQVAHTVPARVPRRGAAPAVAATAPGR